ncbi:hypothetical protein TNCV_89561 [Trichonephila clavipes]|nr:hypothetical protein TNCV_89561 [Trichonephila clavipes]
MRKVEGLIPAQVDGFSRYRKSTTSMSKIDEKKDPLRTCLGTLGKISFPSTISRIVRAQAPPSGEKTGCQNYLWSLVFHLCGVLSKRGVLYIAVEPQVLSSREVGRMEDMGISLGVLPQNGSGN